MVPFGDEYWAVVGADGKIHRRRRIATTPRYSRQSTVRCTARRAVWCGCLYTCFHVCIVPFCRRAVIAGLLLSFRFYCRQINDDDDDDQGSRFLSSASHGLHTTHGLDIWSISTPSIVGKQSIERYGKDRVNSTINCAGGSCVYQYAIQKRRSTG
jgi:hypothetical protein